MSIQQINTIQNTLYVEDTFMPEEFETMRVKAKEHVNKSFDNETIGIKKIAMDKVQKSVQENLPAMLTPVKASITESCPTSAPVVNVFVETFVEPAVIKFAKYTTQILLDKCARPALESSVDTSIRSSQKSSQKTVQTTQSFWSWFTSSTK